MRSEFHPPIGRCRPIAHTPHPMGETPNPEHALDAYRVGFGIAEERQLRDLPGDFCMTLWVSIHGQRPAEPVAGVFIQCVSQGSVLSSTDPEVLQGPLSLLRASEDPCKPTATPLLLATGCPWNRVEFPGPQNRLWSIG